jgi:hypothetical protein
MKKNVWMGMFLVLALVAGMAFAPARTASAQVGVPITGTFTDALGGVGTFTGNFDITRFVARNGQLLAVGSLTGTLTDSLGNVIGSITQLVTIPVLGGTGTCDILHLTLGPLDLTLLGLVVHLNQVVLDIVAQSGAGQLLGNLLCAVAHLLDGGGPVSGIAALLNNILHILG